MEKEIQSENIPVSKRLFFFSPLRSLEGSLLFNIHAFQFAFLGFDVFLEQDVDVLG